MNWEYVFKKLRYTWLGTMKAGIFLRFFMQPGRQAKPSTMVSSAPTQPPSKNNQSQLCCDPPPEGSHVARSARNGACCVRGGGCGLNAIFFRRNPLSLSYDKLPVRT